MKTKNIDTKEDQVIILAKINQLKDMQIFLLKEEEKLKTELSRIVSLSDERRRVLDSGLVVAFND